MIRKSVPRSRPHTWKVPSGEVRPRRGARVVSSTSEARISTPGSPGSPESRTPFPLRSSNFTPETQKVSSQNLLSSTRKLAVSENSGRKPWKQPLPQTGSICVGSPSRRAAGVNQSR